jgi:hypothetical protein
VGQVGAVGVEYLRWTQPVVLISVMEKLPSDVPNEKEIEGLLASHPVVLGACELDLLVFLYRHPRTFLTNEQLAAFVGYDMKQIAQAMDAFTEAGLLERTTQNSMHAARMYLLLLDGPGTGGIKTLLDLASTRQGRRHILRILVPQGSNREHDNRVQRRLHAIA